LSREKKLLRGESPRIALQPSLPYLKEEKVSVAANPKKRNPPQAGEGKGFSDHQRFRKEKEPPDGEGDFLVQGKTDEQNGA